MQQSEGHFGKKDCAEFRTYPQQQPRTHSVIGMGSVGTQTYNNYGSDSDFCKERWCSICEHRGRLDIN